ncbi:MAG: hypothetical protein GY795_24520 [Desulfobacterales bacterium]|nr:hypothetical protein [Desulfobacterales bacterium]
MPDTTTPAAARYRAAVHRTAVALATVAVQRWPEREPALAVREHSVPPMAVLTLHHPERRVTVRPPRPYAPRDLWGVAGYRTVDGTAVALWSAGIPDGADALDRIADTIDADDPSVAL